MNIGKLSERTGVSRRLLRYYEDQGLLVPRRDANGYRVYAQPDVETVRGIRQLLEARLTTATIAELLPCMVDRGDGLAPLCPDLLPDLDRERDRLTEAIGALAAAREALDRIIAAGRRESPVDDGRALACPA